TGSHKRGQVLREADLDRGQGGVSQPVQAGEVRCALVQGWVGGGRGEVVDHDRAAGGEEAGRVGGCAVGGFGGAASVQDEEVVGGVVLDAAPVGGEDLDLGAVGEQLGGDAGAFGVAFDAGQPYAVPRTGGQPGQ